MTWMTTLRMVSLAALAGAAFVSGVFIRSLTPAQQAIVPAVPAGPACASDVRVQIDNSLAEISKLKDMEQGKVYELPAGGKMMSGYGDDFLRRRTAQEVLASGLASGCGDYAISFLYRLEQCGFKANFIDSAQISTASLQTHDSGHTVVAVRDETVGRWILADPTAGRVISENWEPSSKTFYGNYWIGYFRSEER